MWCRTHSHSSVGLHQWRHAPDADWTKSTMTDPKTVEGVVFAQNLCKLGYSPKPAARSMT